MRLALAAALGSIEGLAHVADRAGRSDVSAVESRVSQAFSCRDER